MYISMSRLRVPAERAEALVGAFRARVGLVGWLAGVLEARDFPIEHLASNLELAAEVVEERIGASPVAARLQAAAAFVRSRPSFLDQ
jgi:hypothetical protein